MNTPAFSSPLDSRRGLNWMLVAAVFCVAGFAAVVVNSLGHRGDDARRGETTLARLEQ